MGKYDLTAEIDYVLNKTNRKKINIIAFSMGTSQTFSALAENHGSLRDKIGLFIAMGPVVFMKDASDRTIGWMESALSIYIEKLLW